MVPIEFNRFNPEPRKRYQMLLKFQTTPEQDEAIEQLKKYFDKGSAAGAVQDAILELPDMLAELEHTKRRLGAVEHAHGELKQLIRRRNKLDVMIRECSEQEEMEV